MKRILCAALAALLTLGLAGCGGTKAKEVDLTAYYTSMEEQMDWGDGYMVDMTEEMLDTYYPGLRDIETKQFIAKAPMMSAAVAEVVLLECTTPEDAEKAAELLQKRADEQAQGGAWYPASMEAWGDAQVSVKDNYAALLVSGEKQTTLTDAYQALFQ